MRVNLWIPALGVLLIAGGCGREQPPPAVSPISSDPRDSSGGQIPVVRTTIDEILKDAPTTLLVKHDFTIGDIEFTIDAPPGTTIADRWISTRKVIVGEAAGLEIEAEHRDLSDDKKWWSGTNVFRAVRIWEMEDVLFFEGANIWDMDGEQSPELGARFHFVANVTLGPIELGIRFSKKEEIGAVMGTKADALLMLKCARSIALKNALPKDPAALLERLGAQLRKDDAGKVEAVTLNWFSANRSALPILKELPDLVEVRCDVAHAKRDDFAILKDLPRLEVFRAFRCTVGDEGLKWLGQCPGLTSLSVIQDGGHITPQGMLHLRSLKGLKRLEIDGGNLASGWFEILSDMPDLEVLSLMYTDADDESMKAIAGIAQTHGLRKLRVVNVKGCNVTSAGVAELRKAIPDVEVYLGR